jgi:hypothetical protein
MPPPRSSLLLEKQERLFVDKKIWAERMDTGTFHLDPSDPPSLQEEAIHSLHSSSVGNCTSIQAVRFSRPRGGWHQARGSRRTLTLILWPSDWSGFPGGAACSGGMTDTRWIPAFAGMTDASGNDDRPTGLFDQDDRDVVDVGACRRDTNEVAQMVEEVVGVVVLKEG